MPFTLESSQFVQGLYLLILVLAVPIAVGLLVVLFQLAFLLHSVTDFVRFVTYELTPVVKDIRALADSASRIGLKASAGVKGLENLVGQVGPCLKEGASRLKSSASAIFSGVGRSFFRSSTSR